ncbi:unnamed protein product [Cylicocyclus nassatus]|uniref:Uncharacterized protein n=1 Tax=Cylicocyclus nassatus TaxID=53992 RepID=A0AA36HC47_CYLNA|nr:unnamed protein product [Cylicocyclus nassatus]
MSLLIFCALATLGFAAPPLVQDLKDYPCVDGVNNVVTLGDIDTAGTTVHVDGAVAHLYDSNGNPSCEKGKPMVAMPGLIRLVKGKVIVKEGTDIKKSGVAKWTVTKQNIGTLCKDGEKVNVLIPDKFCKQNTYPLIGDDFAKMFATPGEYDLEVLLKTAGVTAEFKTPKLNAHVNEIVRGEWQAVMKFESEGKTIAHIKAPSNDDWLFVE